jgi:hypothetical protein
MSFKLPEELRRLISPEHRAREKAERAMVALQRQILPYVGLEAPPPPKILELSDETGQQYVTVRRIEKSSIQVEINRVPDGQFDNGMKRFVDDVVLKFPAAYLNQDTIIVFSLRDLKKDYGQGQVLWREPRKICLVVTKDRHSFSSITSSTNYRDFQPVTTQNGEVTITVDESSFYDDPDFREEIEMNVTRSGRVMTSAEVVRDMIHEDGVLHVLQRGGIEKQNAPEKKRQLRELNPLRSRN